MSTRYVVIVQCEDATRVFGSYADYGRAVAFAEKVNAELEAREDAEFAAWQALPSEDSGMMPGGAGRASVRSLNAPRYREALAFGLTGNPDPAYARKSRVA